ncbi:sulfatase [Nocardioides sp. KR10-350]|uniref:sulfatase family protein n=1 Tax=Nocardioides cheoyonin TaxID=3156615 RepID=UPI0032B35581
MRRPTTLAALAVAVLASTAVAIDMALPGSPVEHTTASAQPGAAGLGAARPGPHTSTAILPKQATPTPSWTPYGAAGGRRPNIMMITSDDLSLPDLKYMPHVRAIFQQEGVTFSDAIAPTPICVPSRASLLSGQYAHNHGAVTISGPHGGFAAFDENRTLPIALQRAGYDTLFTGKYLNGYGETDQSYVPPGWTDWRATVDPWTYGYFNPRLNHNGLVTQYERYTTYLMQDQTNEMLNAPARQDKPWFMWVNYVAPHHGGPTQSEDPAYLFPGTGAATIPTTVPAPRDDHRYDGVRLPRRPDLFRTPTGVPANSPSRRHWTPLERTAMRMEYDQRIEAVQALDRAVASHLRVLRRTHQLSRTIILFGSDNGFSVGGHNVNGKLDHYDQILRVPLMMRGPRVPQGRTVRTTVTIPDLTATFLAIAGAKPLRPLDGVDIMPWLRGPRQMRVVPIEGWPVKDGSHRFYSGVRVGPWTYVRYRVGGEELYNRTTDPYEIHSLVGRPGYRAQLRQLRRLTDRYRDCRGASCPKSFYPAPSRA